MTLTDKEKLKEIDKIICDELTHAGRTYTDEEKLEQIYQILHSTKNYEENRD